ncbi:ATP-binding protein [Flavobacterium sp. CBA20B-1]|uniref:hybrid sensor histidine kinase/response regulator n=1 Tax=unclassified Flavobacterium TaxID=196869 RepID=UPI0022255808|nr:MULTISPECIES: hybrid sensor histidine kinase/response regulator [unclassified Flavobacterium]WCM43090.1 ATP-binding protein [Flavobacterium sp. CBA20B-1]
MTTEQTLKIKLTLGYILLISIFSVSILYILNEVKNLNVSKDDILSENTKVIQLGTIVSDLYATENTGRLALLSYSKTDAAKYHTQLDSLIQNIEMFKQNNVQDESLHQKLDTIIDLINLKSLTFDQVLDVQSKYAQFNVYENALSEIKQIQKLKEEQTIKIDTTVERPNFWSRLKNRFKDNEKVIKEVLVEENDKLAQQQIEHQRKINAATESVLDKAKKEENKLLKQYYLKEELLIKRNKKLTEELREILNQVEKIIIQNSSINYESSKEKIDAVSNNIAKIGIVISIVALVFGFIILIDLNKSARNKQKLEKLNGDMQDLIKQKSFFMATISHDMVSPINSLLGFSALLQNSLKTPKQKEFLKNIIHSTKYIKKMVDDLSLFSNLEFNKIKLKKGKFNFNELLQNICNNLKNSAERKKIDLIFNIDEQLNTAFYSDSFRIQQILTNVISNAIKFTHHGSVTVDATLENNIAKFKITDTGIGIKTENKDDLFVEFMQAHDNSENNYGGSGLGLNITKRLVNLLKGAISFESEYNKGTVFYIDIPLELFEESKEVKTVNEIEYDNAKKLENKKILVIDDDPLQLKLIEEIFSNKVKKLTTIENGKLAKKILQEEQYQLIITDMQMPFYSGIKVIEDIRSLENYKDIPVIALTGKIDFDEHEYQKLGFNFYMKKPLNINTLYNVIYKMLRIKNKRSQTVTNKNSSTMTLKNELFDLTDLFTLLENDKNAAQQILNAFFESYKTDIEKIQRAFEASDLETVKLTAHKMLPMFRQLKIAQIVNRLLLLEQKTEELSIDEMANQIEAIRTETPAILNEIAAVIA